MEVCLRCRTVLTVWLKDLSRHSDRERTVSGNYRSQRLLRKGSWNNYIIKNVCAIVLQDQTFSSDLYSCSTNCANIFNHLECDRSVYRQWLSSLQKITFNHNFSLCGAMCHIFFSWQINQLINNGILNWNIAHSKFTKTLPVLATRYVMLGMTDISFTGDLLHYVLDRLFEWFRDESLSDINGRNNYDFQMEALV